MLFQTFQDILDFSLQLDPVLLKNITIDLTFFILDMTLFSLLSPVVPNIPGYIGSRLLPVPSKNSFSSGATNQKDIHPKSQCHWCHWHRQFFGISAKFQTDNTEPIQLILCLETALTI